MCRTGLVLFCWIALGGLAMSADLDFNRDIRPILSDKCYFCHGPDESNREADLRLDIRSEAVEWIESGDFIERIVNEDADMRMPPPESKLVLDKHEKELLARWVEEGAPYAIHWAFEPLPRNVEIPSPAEAEWCRSPIDHFVLSRLEAESLFPSRSAEPLRWLRRVTMDLTGLPPSETEIDQFRLSINKCSCRADRNQLYAKTVDGILESKAFGEQLAISWLDAARYADSYGYQSDKLNTQWPYRDWVVKALNENLPYNKFLQWQLAGDLLPDSTSEQKLATAFNRVHRLNNEGGAVFEEWRIENVADRVHTFGTAVLGLTMECCRCHDHKYDPISMRDYYSLSAFFNSIDESGVYDRTAKVPCPSILLPSEKQRVDLEAKRRRIDDAMTNYQRVVGAANGRFQEWMTRKKAVSTIPDAVLMLGFDRPFSNELKDIYHPSQSDRSWSTMSSLVPVVDGDVPRIDKQLLSGSASQHFVSDELADSSEQESLPRRAISLDGERGVTAHGVTPFDRFAPFSVIMSMRDEKRSKFRSVIAHHTRGTDCGYNGWDLTIQDGYLESRLARVWPGNAISVRSVDRIPANQWGHIAATYDGSSVAKGLKLFLNGKQLETEVLRDELKKLSNVKVDHGGQFVIGQRFRDRGFDGGMIDDVAVFERSLTSTELQRLSGKESAEATFDYFVSAIDGPSREAFRALTAARKAYVLAEEAIDEIPIMRELSEVRETHILARGQYDAKVDASTRVKRDTFSQVGKPFPKDEPRDRLGLSQWVTDPDHPLTARVAVNRIWGHFFPQPLVRTPENFGSQGALPTHPKLLDWLSRDFVDGGWDVKRLCRQIVLSSTYRQDSRVTEARLRDDPENELLGRGPSNRLSAEQIRDLALAASGLLDRTLGGPPVSPYQPGRDLWRESNGMSPAYKQSVGKSLYRRSIYSVWKRTAPLPNMLVFDATTREVCTMARSRTNSPLQALVLLNDTQFVEAARVLAEKTLAHEEIADRIRVAFVRLTGRDPDAEETQLLASLFHEEQAHFQSNFGDAEMLVQIGDSEVGDTVDICELAAMTTVCSAILNLDATNWKR